MSFNIEVGFRLKLGEIEANALIDKPSGALSIQFDNIDLSAVADALGYHSFDLLEGQYDIILKIKPDNSKFLFSSKDDQGIQKQGDLELILAKVIGSSNPAASGESSTANQIAVVRVDCQSKVELNKLPKLGSFFPSNSSISLKRFLLAKASNQYQVTELILTKKDIELLGNPNALLAGFTLAAELAFNDQSICLHTETGQPNTQPKSDNPSPIEAFATGAPSAGQPKPIPSAGGSPASVKWVSLQRSIGPIHLNRIGGRWIGGKDGGVQALLDAGLSTSAFAIEFSGLAVTVPLFQYSSIDHYSVQLSGLAVSFSSPSISIEGGLAYASVQGIDSYAGSLVVTAPSFSLIAAAGFQKFNNGDYSLFAVAKLKRALGGPPAFQITAITLGFGYNRAIIAPTIRDVQSFPLLTLDNSTIEGASKAIDGVSPFEAGQYWIAAGIEFSSFGHFESKVLAILEVGKETAILILGQTHGKFPAESSGPTYGYIELDIEIVIEPAKGLFKAEAILSHNSYVLDPNCHLTGGFAFYSWFGASPNAGDFVFTVGGYHPAFQAPSHYPVVPRLGFNWQVSEHVQIKGGAYLAITPSCVMAGGSLEVLFQDGNLRAWLTAYADFIINWSPFHFQADIGITVGISYAIHFWFINTTLRFELGATLNLYGPPTGGVLHIHLWVISFSIAFGAQSNSVPPPLGRDEFLQLVSKRSSPDSTSSLISIAITSGLIREHEEEAKKIWIIRAGAVAFDITTPVPARMVTLNNANVYEDKSPICARPMRAQLEASALTITIAKVTLQGVPEIKIDKFTSTPYKQNLPGALWGGKDSSTQPELSADLFQATVGLRGIKLNPPELQPIGPFDAQHVFAPQPINSQNSLLPIDPNATPADARIPRYRDQDPDSNEAPIATYHQDLALQGKVRLIVEKLVLADPLIRAPSAVGAT
jgi:hypothetical protein